MVLYQIFEVHLFFDFGHFNNDWVAFRCLAIHCWRGTMDITMESAGTTFSTFSGLIVASKHS